MRNPHRTMDKERHFVFTEHCIIGKTPPTNDIRSSIGDLFSAWLSSASPRPPMALIGLSRDRPALSASRMSTFIILPSRWQHLSRACKPLLLSSPHSLHGRPLRSRVESFHFYFILISYVSRTFTDRSIHSPLLMHLVLNPLFESCNDIVIASYQFN